MKTWDERAQNVLAQGCTTYSRRSDQFIRGVHPTHITHGDGCYVYTPEGERLLDFIGGLGSTILENCNNYALPTIDEVILAERVREIVPCCEKMRFLKTGSEATQAAVRIARAYCDKNKKHKYSRGWFGVGTSYRGWHNWCIAAEKPGAGCWDEGYRKAKDIDMLIEVAKDGVWDDCMKDCRDIGYIILEPFELDCSNDRISKLETLRDECSKKAIVLIFDEVVSGFRVPGYTVANYTGIQPDLICLGKAMGNGAAISVVGGNWEIMDTPDWFVSSTFAGEHSGIKAALETIERLTPAVINEIWQAGGEFQKAFNAIAPNLIQLIGINTKMVYKADDMVKALFMQEMRRVGILTGKALHVTLAQVRGGKLGVFLGQAEPIIRRIERGEVKLEGEMFKEIFRRY